MRILLDTVAILMMTSEPTRLSALARRELSNGSNTLYVSTISVWEISAKCSTGKLVLSKAVPDVVSGLVTDHLVTTIEFDLEDALAERSLPLIHRDPFDRMLICQALTRGLVIATPDQAIRQYRVPMIW